MKGKKLTHRRKFGPVPKSNRKIVQTEAISIMHDRSLSWLITCTSMKSGGDKLS